MPWYEPVMEQLRALAKTLLLQNFHLHSHLPYPDQPEHKVTCILVPVQPINVIVKQVLRSMPWRLLIHPVQTNFSSKAAQWGAERTMG